LALPVPLRVRICVCQREDVTMTDTFEPQKFDLYLSAESEAKVTALVGAGKVGSAVEALLLAVDIGLDHLLDSDNG